nr:MAG TPA: hypothetical protein [Bacteriophage sp.]
MKRCESVFKHFQCSATCIVCSTDSISTFKRPTPKGANTVALVLSTGYISSELAVASCSSQ